MTWDVKYPIDSTITGDTVTEAVLKQQKELRRIYGLMNRVRKLDFAPIAPGDPIEGHAWINNQGRLSIWNGSTWACIGNITDGATFPAAADILPGHIHLYSDNRLYVWDGFSWLKLCQYENTPDITLSTSDLTLDSAYFPGFPDKQAYSIAFNTPQTIDKGKLYGSGADSTTGVCFNLVFPENSLHRMVFMLGNSVGTATDMSLTICQGDPAVAYSAVPLESYTVNIDATKTSATTAATFADYLYLLKASNPNAFYFDAFFLRISGVLYFVLNILNEPSDTTVANTFLCYGRSTGTLTEPVWMQATAPLIDHDYKTLACERLF